MVVTDVSYIILEFGMMGQRNNKRSGKTCVDEVQKVIKMTNFSNAESKVN